MQRIAIIGAGIRGSMYATALRGQPGTEVVALVEPAATVAARAHQATGIPVHPDITSLLEAHSPTAAIIATPDFAHHDPAVALADAGLDLLIEKPLATDMEQATAIATAVQEAGVRCMVGFENRWNPHFVRTKELVETGQLGQVLNQRAVLSNTYRVPEQMLSWAAASSPAWFLLPHTADLACWLSGKRPTAVVASATQGQLASRGIDTWDSVEAVLRFEDGSTATLSSSWVEPESMPSTVEFTYSLTGATGAVRASLSDQGLQVATSELTSVWPLSGSIGGDLVGAAVWMARDWARMLAGQAAWGPDEQHGLLITRIIAAVETSVATGRWVELPFEANGSATGHDVAADTDAPAPAAGSARSGQHL